MKKISFLSGVFALMLTFNTAQAASTPKEPPQKPPMEHKMQKMTPEEFRAKQEKRREEFNKKLGLSEEQIKKAKEIRMAGHQKMKPVMEQIKAKRQEMFAVKNSKLSIKAQDKKIEALKKDIFKLDQQARQIRQDNEKEFEAILTPEQKTKYAQIKEEGRKNFEKRHGAPHRFDKPGPRPCDGPKAMPACPIDNVINK